MNTELKEKDHATADSAVTQMPTDRPEVGRDRETPETTNKIVAVTKEGEALAPLFPAAVADDFRSRWSAVQSSFVDDPEQAVRHGDELVAEVLKSLADSFSNERAKLEGQVNQTDNASTEDLRIALRRYRSFFERLLSL
jgi:hypothetical protein